MATLTATPNASSSGNNRLSGASGEVSRPVVVAVVAALAALAVLLTLGSGQYGGAFIPLVGFSDGGDLARFGLPVARTIHDIFGAATVGLLLMAGTMLPDTARTTRRETACRTATATGVVWVAAGFVTLLLVVSNVTGVHLGDANYVSVLTSFLWSMDLFRVYFISVLIAVSAVVGSAVVRSKTAMVWMAVLSLAALLPLALAGHSGGSLAHDTAVNSLAVHMAAAYVWCGGLVAILVLWPVLGDATAVVVQRYSVLAGWCLAGVAVSGVLNAAVRIGEFSQIASDYGVVVLVKTALLAVVGAAGWRMRSGIVARVTAHGPVAALFRRLAAVEVLVMAGAIGVGVGLSRSHTPVPRSTQVDPDVAIALTGYPAPRHGLSASEWFTVWRIDWLWLAVALLGVGLYGWAVLRLRHRGDSWPWYRTIPWVFGWVLFVWTTSGAPGVYGRVQFSLHMFMHMMLTMGIPVFLSLGAPLSLISRALPARRDKTMGPREILLATAHSRWLNFWANPVMASINFAGSLYVFYFTGLFELALRTHTGHVAMVVHFMLAGYVFCWSLIGIDPGPKRWAPSLRLVALFVTMSVHAFFGVAIMSATSLLAPDFFHALSLPWVGDLLADQQAGGGITWGIGEFPMLMLALLTAAMWMRADENEARRYERQAERDHDAELAAYNAQLARRAEATRRREELRP
ncbi:hypothetical protein KEM60_01349 [Austwickia sp. TVS 96-490-7B]|uniref:cytochrome c oxidase assembly protein n=1 Tax=Austwickia sp. TVS 96-490-7B TaxID=2830843 RepID=UPI001C56C3D8|nr:cytochrome c oxidase assembly protein [Austwickia sp. TVS 96-490-7B]MBW3085152.1 hypothetical protein [Austwickia sp. TVS 96-490-7B]